MSERFLAGRTAWVTGGASGMGRATALGLAAAGADIAIGSLVASQRGAVLTGQNCHTPPDESLARTRGEIEAQGVRGLAFALDVCSDESVEASYQAVRAAFGKIDILINAAGSSARKYIADHPDEIWHRMLDGDALRRGDPRIDDQPQALAGQGQPVRLRLRDDPMLMIEDDGIIAAKRSDLAGRKARIFEPEGERRLRLPGVAARFGGFALCLHHCEPMAMVMSWPSMPSASGRQRKTASAPTSPGVR